MSRAAGPAAEPSSERQRLFFAVWPEEEARRALAALARRTLPRQGKPVATENLHITLVFLGSVTPGQCACAERAAAQVTGPAFTLRLERLGWYRRARVVWSAPAQTPEALRALVAGLNRGLGACGFEPDTRPYHAHVTLARKVARRVDEAAHPPIEWTVDAFHLVQSRTHPEGSRYHTLRSWPLVAPA
ncbi:MAG: RNA 2',3'-cyclic phosphodiesterase [Gammaproteobacteria bacterium]|nr:RNA 2',3'-cyclic phosphodiesterase [Gammaproteobacteria bacterium]